MIFDAYIISIDWGVEELFVLAKEKWRFHKKKREYQRTGCQPTEMDCCFGLVRGGGFEHTLLSIKQGGVSWWDTIASI